MAMMKLTKDMRIEIVERILRAKWKAPLMDMCRQEAELAHAILRSHFTHEQWGMIQKLPEHLFKQQMYLSVRVELECGKFRNACLRFDGLANAVFLNARAQSWDAQYSHPALSPVGIMTNSVEPSKEVTDKVVAFEEAAASINEAARVSCQQVSAIVGAHRTAESLLAAWPEIKTFVDEVIATYDQSSSPIKLPAISMAALNALLDLPPEVKEHVAA